MDEKQNGSWSVGFTRRRIDIEILFCVEYCTTCNISPVGFYFDKQEEASRSGSTLFKERVFTFAKAMHMVCILGQIWYKDTNHRTNKQFWLHIFFNTDISCESTIKPLQCITCLKMQIHRYMIFINKMTYSPCNKCHIVIQFCSPK